MWLVLCTADDRSGLWAATELRARGLDPLVILTPDRLHYSFRWLHRIGAGAAVDTKFALADGCLVDSRELRGVLNRISTLPPHLVNHLPPGERRFALQEWTALHASWLTALSVPVLNVPVGSELCGARRHQSEWTWLATQAGFDTLPFSQSTGAPSSEVTPSAAPRRSVVIVDGELIDPAMPKTLAMSCEQLAELAGTRLLGVDLDCESGAFVSATPCPDLQAGGDRVVTALCDVLTHRA